MKKILSSNVLKIIAVLAMVLDHVAHAFISATSPIYYIFRIIGRIAAPVMFFGIANGYVYTKNKFKYGRRLLLLALISQIPYSLFLENKLFLVNNYNIVFTMFLGFVCLCVLYNAKNIFYKSITIFIGCVLSLFCEYSLFGIGLILLFSICNNMNLKIIFYCLMSIIYIVYKTVFEHSIFLFIINIGLFLAIPCFYFYSEKKGKYNLKYLFYVFYPVQFLVIFLIRMLFC